MSYSGTDSDLADLIIDRLNDIAKYDPRALIDLIEHRVECNGHMANHPTVQVQKHPDQKKSTVGFLGLLNGIIGAIPYGKKEGWGYITMLIDPEPVPPIIVFERTKED